jgi:hypothetical protein
MSDSASPRIQFLPCGGATSTVYTFVSKSFQDAANTVYVQKSTLDAVYAAKGSNQQYQFKSQAERLQYLIGKTAQCTRF